MSVKPHDARLGSLRKNIVPDHRNLSEAQLKAAGGINRAERRAKKKQVNEAYARCTAVMALTSNSGVGLPADQSIRELANECNSRNLSHGLTAMPIRFNVLEAFLHFRQRDNAFEVLPERDHLFSLDDFLEFKTGPDARESVDDTLGQLDEGVIHSFNAVGDLDALSFLDGDGNRFVAAAITFVRHGDELSWMLVGGTVTDIEAETARIQEKWRKVKPNLAANNRKHLDLDNSPPAEAVTLEGAPNAWRTLLLGRSTLGPITHEARYFCRDEGATYDTHTDDPAIFQVSRIDRLTVPQLELLAQGEAVLSKHNLATQIAETLFSLPAYFRFKIRMVVEREHRTNLGDPAVMRALGRSLNAAGPKDRVVFRKVASLEILDFAKAPAIRTYRPPSFQVSVEGFWRRLSNADADGIDRQGLPTKGRTWVKGHMRWRQQPPPPVVVLVKNSVAMARVRAAVALAQSNGLALDDLSEFGGLPGGPEIGDAQGSSGWVYVMSSPMFDDGIYKVGWTASSPSARAEELSRHTGVPMSFVVVESWESTMARSAERLVHETLANFRINPRREFFRLPFADIRRAIEGVLAVLGSRQTAPES